MTKSKIFLYLCLAFVGGIFVNSFIFVPQLFTLGLLVLGILLISVLWQHKKIVVIGFCFLFLVLGIWRHQTVMSEIFYPEEREITFVGKVVKEPDIRSNNIKLTLSVHGTFHGLKGRVLVTTNRYPEYRYGDELRITGKLQAPEIFDEFNYKDYLAKDGIYSVMYWPEIVPLEREHFSFYGGILQFKNKLRESIYQNLSPPQSTLLGAIILGDKRKMSDELKGKLNITGVRHITAVSGLHVTILTTILMTIFLGLHLGRRAAFYSTIALIFLFIVMTGLQPSAIRAGIMGGLFILAQYLGRQSISSRTIIFAAAVMLVQNPLLLKLDVGFQLSFLAMMGIIYLMPVFKRWLKNNLLSMTLAAQVFTLPILIHNFGYMSFVAPITNILIVPLLPFIMALGFIFGLAGIVFQPLSWVLSWPCWLLLTWITKVVDGFSALPLASLAIKNIHWFWLIISYLILGYITWRLNKKQKLKFLKY